MKNQPCQDFVRYYYTPIAPFPVAAKKSFALKTMIVSAAMALLGTAGAFNAAGQSLTAAGAQLAVPDAGPGTSVGLEGYYFFDLNPGGDLASPPSYATVTDLANGYTGGDYSYLTINGSVYQTGVEYSQAGNLASVTFGAGAPATVRLGLLLDSSSQAAGVTVVTASRSGNTLTINHSGSTTVNNDFYFVDVSGILSGDTITVSATGATGVDANIGGITFDLPPAITMAAAAAQLGVTAVGSGTSIGLIGSYFFDCDSTADINNEPAYATVDGLATPSPGNINLKINGVSHLTGTESVAGGAAGDVASVTFGAGTPSSVLLGLLLDNQTNPPGPIVLRASSGGPQLTIAHSASAPVNNDFYFVNVGGIVAGETIFINAGNAANANIGGITFDAGIGSLAPTVLSQPAGGTNVAGGTITLTASISGIPTPTLQWQFNGASLPGATNATLTLSNLQLTNAGSYVLYATNSVGSTHTIPAIVVVQALPSELVGEWTFAGQTLANTGATASTNDGTYSIAGVSNAPVFSADVPFGNGNSLDLTTPDSYLRINNTASADDGYNGLFDAHSPSFSVAVWEKKPNPAWQDDAWNGFAAKNNGYTASNKGFMLGRNAQQNTPVAQLYNGSYPAAFGATDINDGAWHHLAMTYDAPTTTISLYADGVLQGTATGVYAADTVDPLIFGASEYPVGWRAANALIYDARYYNYALSASQIVTIASLAPTVLSQPNGGTNIVGGTITLTASIGGTPTPTLQWDFNGASLPGATNATLVLSNLQLTNSGSYVLYATNAGGSTNTSPAVVTVKAVTPELIGEWTFAGQTLANLGATAYTNDGTYSIAGVSNAPVFSSDVPFGNGNSLDLTAADSYLRINNTASGDAGYSGLFDVYAPSFTVAVWEKKPDAAWPDDAWNAFAAKNNGASASNIGFMLGRGATQDSAAAQLFNASYPTAYGTTSINDGAWHNLAMTYDATTATISLYVDGALQGTATGVYTADTVDPLVFGAGEYPTGVRAVNAFVYDLRFYNYVLPASQVATIGVPPVPTAVAATVTSGQMTLAWPQDHTGWTLEVQTNALNVGLGTNWTRIPGSAMTNQVNIPINKSSPAVFYRLVF